MLKENDVKCKIPVLVAAKSDRMRDSLQVLLKFRPWLNIVGIAGDSSSTLQMLKERQPELLLLDTNLPGDQVWAVLRQVRAEQPQTRRLILADDTRQKQAAEVAGADAVLIKGFRMAEFFTVIETFCAEHTPGPSIENQTALPQLQPENGRSTRTQPNSVPHPPSAPAPMKRKSS